MIQHIKKRAVMVGYIGATLLMLASPIATARNTSLSDRALDELHEFAANHLDAVQALSFRDGVEYCGLLGYDANGQLTATTPTKGHEHSCSVENEPNGFTVVASYHTHGPYFIGADSEAPSMSDLENDFAERIYGYIATPGGRVWFNDWEFEESTMLYGQGSVAIAPNFRECFAFLPDDYYTLSKLQRRASSDTGDC